MYINLKPQKFEMCIYIKGKLKTHFFLQLFRCPYEIFYSVYIYTCALPVITTMAFWQLMPQSHCGSLMTTYVIYLFLFLFFFNLVDFLSFS